jgi:hypothetical protein
MRQKKSPHVEIIQYEGFYKKRRVHLAILTPSFPGTTFAATELDFRVRDVTGYFLSAIDTPKLLKTNLGTLYIQSQNKTSNQIRTM